MPTPPKKGKNYTWERNMVKKQKGKTMPNGYALPEGTFTQSPGEIARRLKQHSKDFNQAQKRLTVYKNRQGRNLNPTEKEDMEHAKDALRQAYGVQEKPAPKPKTPAADTPTVSASVRIKASRLLKAADEKWSKDVKTKKHPPKGLFAEGTAGEIASWLHKSHDDLQGAMGALNFYINRAGENLSEGRKGVLNSAEKKIQKMYA